MDFTVLDVDVARAEPQSICRIGLVQIEQGKFVHKTSHYVQPPKNAYSIKHQALHGVRAEDTAGAPLWPEVWVDLRIFIENRLIVTPRAAFTLDCLFHAQQYYMLPHPIVNFECIYCLTGMDLQHACEKYDMAWTEQSDPLTRACITAHLYMQICGENKSISAEIYPVTSR